MPPIVREGFESLSFWTGMMHGGELLLRIILSDSRA